MYLGFDKNIKNTSAEVCIVRLRRPLLCVAVRVCLKASFRVHDQHRIGFCAALFPALSFGKNNGLRPEKQPAGGVPWSVKDALSIAACNLFQWSEAERCFCRGGGLCFGTKPCMAWTACESLLSDTHGRGRHVGRRPQTATSVFIFSPPPAPPKGGGKRFRLFS